MKPTFATLALTSLTPLLASGARAGNLPVLKDTSTMLIQVAGTTVAILPPDPQRTRQADSTQGSTLRPDGAAFKGSVKLVVTAPGRGPVTITGGALTLVPQGPAQNEPSPVAVVSANAFETQINAGSATRTSQDEMAFSGRAVVTVPGQTPVTIAGDKVALTLHK